MKISTLHPRAFALLALLFIFPSNAFAAGGGDYSSLFWPALNFALYAALVVFFFKKHASPALRVRSIQIANHIQKAASAVAVAEQDLFLLKERMANLEEEKVESQNQFREEGERMAEGVLVNARTAVRRIEEDAERQIETELLKAEALLREEAIKASTAAVRAQLRAGISEEQDQKLRQRALESFL